MSSGLFVEYEQKREEQCMEAKFTPGNGILIGLNTAVMAFTLVASTGVVDLLYYFGVMDWHGVLQQGQYYRFISSMFLHFGFDHFFQNMVFLSFVGCFLETALGSGKYVLFYLLSGIGAGACSMFFEAAKASNVVSAGASGAIFGVVGGLLWVVVRNRGNYKGIGLPGMALMIVGTLYYGFTSSDVDNAAHLGGVLCGFLLGMIFYRKKE